MDKELKVLFIEQHADRLRMLHHFLDRAATTEGVSNAAELGRQLKARHYDLIVSDDFIAEEHLRILEEFPDAESIPVVVVNQVNVNSIVVFATRGDQKIFKGEVNHEIFQKLLHFGIERQQVQQLKNDYIGTVSHELRTPLTILEESIAQVVDGLLGETSEEQKDTLNIALKSVSRLTRIVNDLLDISKIEAGKVVLVKNRNDFREVVEDVLGAFSSQAQKRGIILRAHMPEYPVALYMDRDKITQVLTNLLSNALKFTEQGSVEVFVSDREQEVECAVVDTGHGMSPEDLSKIFNRFEQCGKRSVDGQRGTGLGLAISRGLIELHRGEIAVDSTLGRGTRFRFTIPRISEKEVVSDAISQQMNVSRRNKKALAVVVYNISEQIAGQLADQTLEQTTETLSEEFRNSLRQKIDFVLVDRHTIYIILPETDKEQVHFVTERLQIHISSLGLSLGLDLGVYARRRILVFDETAEEADFIQRVFASFQPA